MRYATRPHRPKHVGREARGTDGAFDLLYVCMYKVCTYVWSAYIPTYSFSGIAHKGYRVLHTVLYRHKYGVERERQELNRETKYVWGVEKKSRRSTYDRQNILLYCISWLRYLIMSLIHGNDNYSKRP